MKKLTQRLFIACFCLVAVAQKPDGKNHFRISNSADLMARLKKDLPQDLQGLRSESAKPACTVDSLINKYWSSSTNALVVNGKEEYGYNMQYNIFLKKKYSWNSFNQNWSNYFKTNLTYDTHDNLLNEASFSASNQGTNTVWNNSGNTTYLYDNNNNQISSTVQYWNSQTNTWKTNSVNTSTYNTSNLITQEIYQSVNTSTGTLVNNYKYTYAYDIFNNPLMFQEYIWNPVASAWDIAYKYNITASGNKITAYMGYEWDATTNSWLISFKGSITYDTNGNQILQTEQTWNTVTNSWKNEYKWTSTYDANNNSLSDIDQNWNSTTNAWENSSRTLYTSNNSNYEVTRIYANWNSSTNTWKDQSETDTYYNCLSVGISEENEAKNTILLYPNPTQTELYVTSDKEFSDITIFNKNGQIVLKSAATTSLNVSSLEKGIYFVQVLDVNGRLLKSEKLIKD